MGEAAGERLAGSRGAGNRQVVRAVDPEMLSVHVGLDSWMEGSGTGE